MLGGGGVKGQGRKTHKRWGGNINLQNAFDPINCNCMADQQQTAGACEPAVGIIQVYKTLGLVCVCVFTNQSCIIAPEVSLWMMWGQEADMDLNVLHKVTPINYFTAQEEEEEEEERRPTKFFKKSTNKREELKPYCNFLEKYIPHDPRQVTGTNYIYNFVDNHIWFWL